MFTRSTYRIVLFLFCVFTTVSSSVWGETSVVKDAKPTFNVKKASSTIEKINLSLSVQNLNLNRLNEAIKTLSPLIEEADRCISDAQKHLNELELLTQQSGGSKPPETEETAPSKATADQLYLSKEIKKYTARKAECRLFFIKAKEAVQTYKTAATQLKQERALSRGRPLWKMLPELINSSTILSLSERLSLPPLLLSSYTWVLGFLLALALASLILFKFTHSAVIRRHIRLKKAPLKYVFLLTATLLSSFVLIYLAFFEPSESELLYNLSKLTFLYLLGLSAITLMFRVRLVRAFFYWYSFDNLFFKRFFIATLCLYALINYCTLLIKPLGASTIIWVFTQTLLLWIAISTAMSFIIYYCRAHHALGFISLYKAFITRTCLLLALLVLTIDALGYHTLALHAATSSLLTLVIIFLSSLLYQGIQKVYQALCYQPKMTKKMAYYFGYKKNAIFTEILILRVTLQVLIILSGLFFITLFWGFHAQGMGAAYDILSNGIHVINMTIYPLRITLGVVTYSLLYLLFRALSTRVTRRQQFEAEEDTQVAIASLLTYIGFTVAVIIGFLIAGFDFTGLAIIAGALSVGIGLGLQSIVNNFVSGLILLLEKPIKPGDRINIEGLEGFVKKIQVRSTHVLTLAREDIIIPNSDLITRRVTNYMYSDKYCRISCYVGVSYDSDPKLVKEVLLSVAASHEGVIQTGKNQPLVLFKSFDESSLSFGLHCMISDVNKKNFIKSDLHFKIAEAFREHNITIAYPQRDIHIKIDDLNKLQKRVAESDNISDS